MLLVEQNVRAAVEIADRAYVLDDGKVVYEGDAGEFGRDEKRVRDSPAPAPRRGTLTTSAKPRGGNHVFGALALAILLNEPACGQSLHDVHPPCYHTTAAARVGPTKNSSDQTTTTESTRA